MTDRPTYRPDGRISGYRYISEASRPADVLIDTLGLRDLWTAYEAAVEAIAPYRRAFTATGKAYAPLLHHRRPETTDAEVEEARLAHLQAQRDLDNAERKARAALVAFDRAWLETDRRDALARRALDEDARAREALAVLLEAFDAREAALSALGLGVVHPRHWSRRHYRLSNPGEITRAREVLALAVSDRPIIAEAQALLAEEVAE